jgi:hypothetical protein
MPTDPTITVQSLLDTYPLFGTLMLVWIITWKGFALWKAAELRQKGWFIAILLIQTLGLLEIVYIFFIAKRYKVEVVEQ